MKSKKLFLALSLVTVLGASLASCAETPTISSDSNTPTTSENSSSESTSTGVTANRIVISKYEGYAKVGDIINLEDYVTLLNGSEEVEDQTAFTATVTSTTVAKLVDGEPHKVEVLAEGSVVVTVSVEGLRDSRFTCEAYSALKSKFADYIANAGQVYTVEYPTYVEQDGKLYLGADEDGNLVASGMGWIHQEDYFAYDLGIFDSQKQGKYTGMMRAGDGKTYEFDTTSRAGDNLNVHPGATGTDLGYYYLNMALPLSVGSFTTTTMDDGSEYLVSDAVTAQDFMQSAMGVSFNGYTASMLGISFYNVAYLNDAGTKSVKEIPVIDIYGTNNSTGQTVGLDTVFLTLEDDIGTIKTVEDYIAAGNHPEAIQDPGVAAKLATLSASKNFTVDAKYYWMDYGMTKVITSDELGEALGQEIVYGSPYHDLAATTYYTENAVVSTIGAGYFQAVDTDVEKRTAYVGVTSEEGAIYSVNNINIEDGTYLEAPAKEAIPEVTDLYSAVASFKGLENSFANADITSVDVDEEKGLTIVNVSDSSTIKELILGVYGLTPLYGEYYKQFLTDTSYGQPTIDYVQSYISYSETEVDFTFAVPMNMGNGVTAMWMAQFTVSHIGTTTIPAGLPGAAA